MITAEVANLIIGLVLTVMNAVQTIALAYIAAKYGQRVNGGGGAITNG